MKAVVLQGVVLRLLLRFCFLALCTHRLLGQDLCIEDIDEHALLQLSHSTTARLDGGAAATTREEKTDNGKRLGVAVGTDGSSAMSLLARFPSSSNVSAGAEEGAPMQPGSGRQTGKKLSIAAIVCGLLCAIFTIKVLVVVWFYPLLHWDPRARSEDEWQDWAVKEDVYGATIFALIYESDICSRHADEADVVLKSRLRMSFWILMDLINNVLQLALVIWSYQLVAVPAASEMNSLYRHFRVDSYSPIGVFNATAFKAFPQREEICLLGATHSGFLAVILICWFARMVVELRDIEGVNRIMRRIKSTEHRSEMTETGDDNVVRVTSLTPKIWYAIHGLILLPKVILTVLILMIGTIWLTASVEFKELILNAVALHFIVEIDDVLFAALAPSSIISSIHNFKWRVGYDERKNTTDMMGYLRSTLFLLFTFTLPICYIIFGQDLPFVGILPSGFSDVLKRCDAYPIQVMK